MAIIKKNGFNFLDGLNSHFIVVDSNRTKDYVQYINEHNITAIALIDSHYSKLDINFLTECPNLKNVNITSSSIVDFDGLGTLDKLSKLSIGEPKTKIDVSQFRELEELYLDINNKVVGLMDCMNLKVLKLWKYKPKSKDITELSNLSNLIELELTQSSVTNLSGLNVFTNLLSLGLYYCSKLESIEEIKEGTKKIRKLSIESCKNISDYNEISVLKELEDLIYTESGEISSIGFIKQLPKLKSFVFLGTTVKDGNLEPCDGLQYVAFTEKKHYSHKRKDFNK